MSEPHAEAVVLEGIRVDFGGVAAVEDLSMQVDHGSVHALIGPNGAGKTTVLNVITRVVRHSRGTAEIFGSDISGLTPQTLAARGVARTFQHPQLVLDASAMENVIMGMFATHRTRLWQDLISLRAIACRGSLVREAAMTALDEVGLADVANAPARSLSYGARKTLELARARATAPRLLLLDEPTAGLEEAEIEELRLVIDRFRGDTTVLVVAHHLDFVMSIADRITVLSSGRMVCSGDPVSVRADPSVIAVYTGVRNRSAS
jgi:branched-chain amino acid transport system ATP-binding protein